jgi:uncharacterized RDD family membrane protein YckC
VAGGSTTPNVGRAEVHGYPLAPLARRAAAFGIDLAIFFALDIILLVLDNATEKTDYYGARHMNPAVGFLYFLWGCSFLLYWWVFDGVLTPRATIGKRAMAIRVVRTDGRPFEGAGAFGRGVARWLSFALLGLGYWWAWSNPSQQTWHDMLAGTAVVDVRSDRPTTTTDARPWDRQSV